jgi:AcrR family transcriptional regulator
VTEQDRSLARGLAPLTRVDRAAAVRRAMRALVARHGLHGTSMAAVAAEAGVATGTAYVHYPSKDDLVLAAYLELKRELGTAAVARLDEAAPPAARFRAMWGGVHAFLAAEPARARFLVQLDSSPLAARAHEAALADGDDPFVVQATRPDMAALLAPLPLEVLYDLGIGPVVRLVATGARVTRRQLEDMATAAWRAITRP